MACDAMVPIITAEFETFKLLIFLIFHIDSDFKRLYNSINWSDNLLVIVWRDEYAEVVKETKAARIHHGGSA